jgi:putative membrane protein
MARHLARRGLAMQDAAAIVTVSTTLQALAQIAFALIGIALLISRAGLGAPTRAHAGPAVVPSVLAASGVLALILLSFYLVQRRGLFGRTARMVARLPGKQDWSRLIARAKGIDLAVERTYRRGKPAAASFALSLVGWLVGAGEVYIALRLLGSPVGWLDALMLESLGQAIRGAAFAVPGALGVQEGGYLLLAPFAGLSTDAALALSLAKRAREILLGVPGLVYLHQSERSANRVRRAEGGDSRGAFL